MELLLPAVITVITMFVAWVTKKLGVNLGRAIVLILAFILSFGAAYFYRVLPTGFWTELQLLFGTQMAIYEVLIKTILKPALDPKSEVKVLPSVVDER